MDWLDLLQWPAFAVTVAAGWLVASDSARRRLTGFGLFLISNVLWVAWGWHTAAWALVALQVFLVVTNLRGSRTIEARTTTPNPPPAESASAASSNAPYRRFLIPRP